MPRPAIDLEPYKAIIIDLYDQHYTVNQIVKTLSDQHNVEVKARTIGSRLQGWSKNKRHATEDSPQLRLQITNLFLHCGLKDAEIVEVLRTEGYQLGLTGLIRIRKDLGLYRRLANEHGEAAQSQLGHIVQSQLDEGVIQGYGRGYLYTHFRSQGHIVSR